MEYARTCLSLVERMLHESKSTDDTETAILESCMRSIEAEHDLIRAMGIIAEFEFTILPVQVRLSVDRLKDVLKDIVDKKDDAYKSYDKLIELARLLTHPRHDDDHDESNMLLAQLRQLIADHALKKRNLAIAKKMCADLIEANYGAAWPSVYNLAFRFAANLVESYEIDKVQDDNMFLSIGRHSFVDSKYLQKV